MKRKLVLMVMSVLFVGIYSVSEAGLFSIFSKKDKEQNEEIRVKVDPNKPGWKQDDKEVTFDWYVNFGWFQGKWGRDGATQAITEATGVDVNYSVPVGDGGQKINTMLSSNTLPDLITVGWWEGAYKNLIEGDYVYALDELAEKYDPYFFEVASKEKLGWYQEADGHTYGYPNASYTREDVEKGKETITSNHSFMVRKDIYEALGKPDMTTKEGFLNALKEAKEKFPEVGGQSLIPLGLQEFGQTDSTIGAYLQDFLAVPLEKNGRAYNRRLDPEYKAWLKTFRKANEMGLIKSDIFVDKRQQIEDNMTQGRYFAMLYPHIDALQPLTNIYNNNPERMYIAVPGPKNSDGDEHTFPGPGISGWTVTFITKNCEDPEKAIRFFTYMMSEEGQRAAYFGKEGLSWEMKDGKPEFLDEVKELRTLNRQRYDQLHGGDYMNWMFMDTAMQERLWPAKVEGPTAQVREFTKGKVQPRFKYERWDATGQEEEAIIAQKVNMKWNSTLPKLITADSEAEFEKIWEGYKEYSEKYDFEKVLDYRTEKMRENAKKLGLDQ
ncbi:MAG: extracellular solute-binding protein [Fusobacteriota bacterium]